MLILRHHTPNNLGANMRPEIKLILNCASTHLNEDKIKQIKFLAEHKLDWQYVIDTACKHGLISLLYTNLNEHCLHIVPSAVLNKIKNFFWINIQRSLLVTGELIKILRLLKEAEIKAVPYKGPALANSVYGNIALRPSGDLDIVVQTNDVLKFKDILISQGYKAKVELTPDQERDYLQAKSEHSYNFFHPEKQILVEIHWRITPEYTSPIEIKHFWEKLETSSLSGTEILTLSLEDWLPILCVHGSRHRWERLNWLCDIAEIIRIKPDINWESIIELTTELDCRRMLFLGLSLAHQLFETNLPPDVLKQVQLDSEVMVLTSEIINDLFAEGSENYKFLGQTSYHIRVREKFKNKVLYFKSFIHWLTVVRGKAS